MPRDRSDCAGAKPVHTAVILGGYLLGRVVDLGPARPAAPTPTVVPVRHRYGSPVHSLEPSFMYKTAWNAVAATVVTPPRHHVPTAIALFKLLPLPTLTDSLLGAQES